MAKQRVLILEPYYSGSHKQFIETLLPLAVDYDSVLGDRLPKEVPRKRSKWPQFEFTLCEMSGKKWHWRARTAALYLSRVIQRVDKAQFDLLFASSVLNLAELIALRPDLAAIPYKVFYFHENQLAYPIQVQKERDFQYGYNQILSCLVADTVVFNSNYNRDSFLLRITPFFKMMPDYRPPDIDDMIRSIAEKSKVLYYPIKFCNIPLMHAQTREKNFLHIIWPHRWEHDKNPDSFFQILFKLKERKIQFKVSVLGESYSEVPKIFEEAKEKLSSEIVHWGYTESKEEYYEILSKANVALSTAIHEFFGVSMLEAAYCGCYPLCPSRLVYPELFPAHCLYQSEEECIKRLCEFASSPDQIPLPLDVNFSTMDWTYCQDSYKALLSECTTATVNSVPRARSPAPSNSGSIASLGARVKAMVNHHKH